MAAASGINAGPLVYPAANIVTFRVFLGRQGQARSAVNGPVLYKERNAPMAAQGRSRRAVRKPQSATSASLIHRTPASRTGSGGVLRAAEWCNICGGVH